MYASVGEASAYSREKPQCVQNKRIAQWIDGGVAEKYITPVWPSYSRQNVISSAESSLISHKNGQWIHDDPHNKHYFIRFI